MADEHPIVGDALIALLRDKAEPLLVYQVYTIGQLHEALESLEPCAVVGEVQLGDNSLLDWWPSAEIATRTRPPLIIFSRETDWCWIGRASVSGAYDYLFKSSPSDQLLASIVRAVNGESADPTGILAAMKRKLRRPRAPSKNGVSLTSREIQVLSHIAIGMSNRQIGFALGISAETAKEHVQNILRKLNVHDRVQAAMWAVQHELLT